MGIFKTTITLENARDVGNAEDGIIKPEYIHRVSVDAIVDSGAFTLAIDENLRRQLGLKVVQRRRVRVADGKEEVRGITETVNLHWKDRWCATEAAVMPEGSPVLFGAFPMEQLDLIVYPNGQRLVGRHGDTAVYYLL
jgi:hypothetical protein